MSFYIYFYMSRAVVSYGYETYTEDPLKMMLVSLQRGFECLLSTWESAFLQSVDDYKVLLSCRAIRFTPNPQENWKYYRMGLVAVSCQLPVLRPGGTQPVAPLVLSAQWYVYSTASDPNSKFLDTPCRPQVLSSTSSGSFAEH